MSRRTLLSRLEQLEAGSKTREPVLIRYGWLASQLPADHPGERHTAALTREPLGGDFEWCDFEERPGPAPE